MNSLNNFNSTGFWGTALEWTRDSLGWIIWLIFKIAFFYIFLIFGGYLSLIALSPILAFLSEKTEEIVSGTKNPFNILPHYNHTNIYNTKQNSLYLHYNYLKQTLFPITIKTNNILNLT